MKTAENLLTAAQELAARVTSADGSLTHTDFEQLRTQLAHIDRRMADCEARGEALPPGWEWTRERIGELLQTFTTPNDLINEEQPQNKPPTIEQINSANAESRKLIDLINAEPKMMKATRAESLLQMLRLQNQILLDVERYIPADALPADWKDNHEKITASIMLFIRAAALQRNPPPHGNN